MNFSSMVAGLTILEVAQEFLDLHEVKPNSQWSVRSKSDRLRDLLSNAGWHEGWPYCASFVEACVGEAYRRLGASPAVLQLIRERFTPSVMRTFENCAPLSAARDPEVGAVFFMQKGMTDLGHAGLVIMRGLETFCSIEGNTSPGVQRVAKDREGDGIYLKIRPLDPGVRRSGLWLRGFLNPMSSEQLAAVGGAA